MITVYGRRNSSNVAKVMWTLTELGLDHERIDTGGPFGGNGEPGYLQMNPNGLVPVLVDGDVTTWESNSIVRYLGAKYGDGSFWPAQPGPRAAADRWMDWGSLTLYPKVVALMQSQPGPARELVLNELRKPCVILDGVLAGSTFMTGDHLTMGDIAIGVHLGRLFKLGGHTLGIPHVAAYHDRLLARAGYLEHCQNQLAA